MGAESGARVEAQKIWWTARGRVSATVGVSSLVEAANGNAIGQAIALANANAQAIANNARARSVPSPVISIELDYHRAVGGREPSHPYGWQLLIHPAPL